MYRRAAFEKAGGYVKRETQPEDYNLFTRMLEAGYRAKRCPEPLLEYRQHSADQANTALASFEQVLFFRKSSLDFEKRWNQTLAQLAYSEKQCAETQAVADRLQFRLDEMCELPLHRLLIHALKRDLRKVLRRTRQLLSFRRVSHG